MRSLFVLSVAHLKARAPTSIWEGRIFDPPLNHLSNHLLSTLRASGDYSDLAAQIERGPFNMARDSDPIGGDIPANGLQTCYCTPDSICEPCYLDAKRSYYASNDPILEETSTHQMTPSAGLLPTDPKERKTFPLYTGLVKYFPRALAAIAHLSWVGNEQHNPGEPLHWAREKSSDQEDTALRHLWEKGKIDKDGERHTTKFAWRALAILELELEEAERG